MSENNSIYSELRENLNSAVNKINAYEFPKKFATTPQAVMNSKFSKVKSYRDAVRTYLNELYDLRLTAYETFLSATSAVYYLNQAAPKIDECEALVNLIGLLTSDEFKAALSAVKTALDNVNNDNETDYTELKSKVGVLNCYINEYKKFMGYDLDDTESLPYMVFSIEKYSGTDKATLEYSTGDKIKLAVRDSGSIIQVDGNNYRYLHYLANIDIPYFESTVNIVNPKTDNNIGNLTIGFTLDNTGLENAFTSDSGTISFHPDKDIYLENGTESFPFRINSSNISNYLIDNQKEQYDATASYPYYYIEEDIDIAVKYLPCGHYHSSSAVNILSYDFRSFNDIFAVTKLSDSYAKTHISKNITIKYSTSGVDQEDGKIIWDGKNDSSNANFTYEPTKVFSKDVTISTLLTKDTYDGSTAVYKYETSADTTFKEITLTLNTQTQDEYTYTLELTFNVLGDVYTIDSSFKRNTDSTTLSENSMNAITRSLFYMCDLERLSGFSKDISADGITADSNAYPEKIKYFTIAEYINIITALETYISSISNGVTAIISSKLTTTTKYINSYTYTQTTMEGSDSSYSADSSDSMSSLLTKITDLLSSFQSVGYGTDSGDTGGGEGRRRRSEKQVASLHLEKLSPQLEERLEPKLLVPVLMRQH